MGRFYRQCLWERPFFVGPLLNQRKSIPPPVPLKFDEDDRKIIARMVNDGYTRRVDERKSWNGNHQTYDQMQRGQVELFRAGRTGPWPNSANLHVQMPFWAIDAVNVRVVNWLWNQVPQVACEPEDMQNDRKKAERAAHMVEWDLQPKRMNARAYWARASKIRCCHGVSVLGVSYGKETHMVRVYAEHRRPEPEVPLIGEDGKEVTGNERPATRLEEHVKYEGPVLFPYEWDDVVIPVGCMNLQPNSPTNPGGADEVDVRQYEYLSLMNRKAEQGHYPYMYADNRDDEFWENSAPAQDRSGAQPNNTERDRQQSLMEGMTLSASTSARKPNDQEKEYKNPEYEILTHYGPYPVKTDNKTHYEECVFYVCREPNVLLGAYRLSDVVYTGVRPLIDQHYHTISNRFYSMGICEIVEHLSEEIDTIHNMRIDVGMATNLPFFFYTNTSDFRPGDITIKPLAGIPVDDARSVTFPHMQNVTTFYEKEEMQLLSLAERVLGITDLFLGVSPTRGAAARHATGFLGSQQEGVMRMSEIMYQDASAFAMMCDLIYTLEVQYGPPERSFRLMNELGTHDYPAVTREDLMFERGYDFRLGANVGAWTQQAKLQQAQSILQLASTSPLTNMSMDRRWSAESKYYRALLLKDPEIEEIIGPRSAVEQAEPKTQEEENALMAEQAFGPGQPAPVHPNDNDMEHIQTSRAFREGQQYAGLRMPNQQGFDQHEMMHLQSLQNKRQQVAGAGAQQRGAPIRPQQGANPMNRAQAQVNNVPAGNGSVFDQAVVQGAGRPGPGGPPSFLSGR